MERFVKGGWWGGGRGVFIIVGFRCRVCNGMGGMGG